jgi:cytoskeletal protein CcmA (bactofilin family)
VMRGPRRPTDPAGAQTYPYRREEEVAMDSQRREWTPAPAPSNDLNALLGRGSEFDGKLTFEGTVRIDGVFTGEITTTDTLVVGETAKVTAEINCGTLVVHGEVNGNVRAASAVELHRPARIRGDITAPSLVVEKGVVFDGRSQMASAASNVIPLATSAVGED